MTNKLTAYALNWIACLLRINIWETYWHWREQGWRSGETARLPPVCPGFDSRTRRHMWVEFVVGSLPCSERFFSGYSCFPLSSKTNISKFQFDLDYCQALYHEPLARVIAQALPVFDIKFTFTISYCRCHWLFSPRASYSNVTFATLQRRICPFGSVLLSSNGWLKFCDSTFLTNVNESPLINKNRIMLLTCLGKKQRRKSSTIRIMFHVEGLRLMP